MKVFGSTLFAVALSVAGAGAVHAGITINGTRVVYPADQREVSLSMVNDGKETRLIQAWVDEGDASTRPDTSKAPFLITPPMARVDPGKGQTLRIMFTGAELPQDRETVFWLNVLEIPPKPKAGSDHAENYMQLAVRSRMKLFYRPKGLQGSPDSAADQASWHILQDAKGYLVECTNNTPFNVSFSDVTFKGSAPVQSVSKGGMCPAMGKATTPVTGAPDASNKLVVTVINDYGGFNEHDVSYTR
ncbi:fimbrial biogenesis chaperone [Dyella telluris]|uniref:Fimbria/pilus periplasmic chaperone n=1 Tax=Dyella telluris TaxID=2763498 RepID=A0A7G8Q3W5_9GAMM|nr:fimbria/pilus periplasmic chaperone [Dyella telluris]QNK01473.1 fimbria/pilus periplasmic chaperone [Dyella telluris]